MERKKIELLAPAGDMERLQMAAAYGADAVYLAGTTFGMRSFAGNFTPEALKEAVELCHRRGIRVHVTCNTMPRNNEVARLPEWLEYLDSLRVDAIILADVGTLALATAHAPHVERHISTQASVVNYQSARAWHQLGAKRVILARELSLDEIREIRDKTPPELELEGPGVRPQPLEVTALWDEDGLPLTQVRKPQMRFRMQLPQSVPPLSILRRQADLTP